jgi:hypothetical protein
MCEFMTDETEARCDKYSVQVMICTAIYFNAMHYGGREALELDMLSLFAVTAEVTQ